MSKALQKTIEDIVIQGKGILAADESNSTMGKRLESISVENTFEERRNYRALLATTPKLNQFISGVILFEETFEQKTNDGKNIITTFENAKIVPGIKVDKGLIPFATSPKENITQGLDGLPERLQTYKQKGARFAKWRAVFSVSDCFPSTALIHANAELLARYAAICQAADIVPIVEPEVLMDGDNSLERCEEVTTQVLHTVFNALVLHQVRLEHIILKPNMVVPGKLCKQQRNPRDIAEATIRTLRRTVPAAVPSINFLSGGQSAEEASIHLNAINSLGPQPWYLSFSYGRALQEHCLKTWRGSPENINTAQAALHAAAKNNSQAALGQFQR